jgi:CHAT domain-containing protein
MPSNMPRSSADAEFLKINQSVDQAQALLQKHLGHRPPPLYVKRQLCKPKQPELARFWSEFVRKISPPGTGEMYELVDALNLIEPSVIAYINSLAYRQNMTWLREAEALLRPALSSLENLTLPIDLQVRVLETLSTTLAEIPAFIKSTGAQLNPVSPHALEAISISQRAYQLARDSENRLAASRAAYNLGRLHYEITACTDLESAVHAALADPRSQPDFKEALQKFQPDRETSLRESLAGFEAAFGQLETLMAIEGPPNDPWWSFRKTDVLYRILELCVRFGKSPEYGLKFEQYVEVLKAARVSARVARRTLARNPEAKKMMYWMEAFKGATVFSMPVMFNPLEIIERMDKDIALMNYVILDEVMLLEVTCGGNTFVKAFQPEHCPSVLLSNFFRPAAVEFEGNSYQTPPKPSDDRVYALDPAGFRIPEPSARRPLLWRLYTYSTEFTPISEEEWEVKPHREEISLEAVSWERQLYKLLFEQLVADLKKQGVRHLVIMPDMALSLLPFHVLEASEATVLADQFSLSYAPCEAVVVDSVCCQSNRRIPQSLLIVQDPTNTLTFAPSEAEMVRSCFPNAKVAVLAGDQATRENIAEAARQVDAIHFCSHGKFDSENPVESGLAIAGGQWFSLDDIANLELREGSLVFLSACETARLKIESRFGSSGITQSFLAAGASTVISTFWVVNDLCAAIIAARFYENLVQRKETRLDSLTEATNWARALTRQDVNAIQASRNIHSAQSYETRSLGDFVQRWIGKPAPPPTSHPYGDYFFWGAFALHGSWT